MLVNKNSFVYSLSIITASLLLALVIPEDLSYLSFALISIIQVVLNIVFVSKSISASLISFSSIFLLFSWFFHCGQILKLAFDIPGNVPLDVTKYVNYDTIVKSFKFYFVSQGMIAGGMMITKVGYHRINSESCKSSSFNIKKSALTLIFIGIIPRLYIDMRVLLIGLSDGYKGVYSIVFPQMLSSIAFFFDAGCIAALLDRNNVHKKTLFWVILIYKCITMMTGARQEKVAFLVIWIFIYFFVTQRTRLRSIAFLCIIVIFGLQLINAIGLVRASSSISMAEIFIAMFSDNFSNLFGSMLGEFGSAFTTLAVTVNQVPINCSFGFGASYLAGLCSIIPTFATKLGLGEATAYISKLSGVASFGGSYLGEIYYNFWWFGIMLCPLVGVVISRIQNDIYDVDCEGNTTKKGVLAAIIMISLILFVRGYFSDMVQKLVWTWIVLYFVNDRPVTIGRRGLK